MTDAEYQALKEDIRENGLLCPIRTYQRQIIDGRHRYRACRELGIPPKFQEWDGEGSLVAFVLSLNARRRHLSESQRAMVAARSIQMFKEEAQQRMLVGKAADPPLHGEEGRKGEAAALAAETVRVSPNSVYRAQAVLKKGIPELQQAVDADQVSVSGADLLARQDEEVQREAVAGGSAAMEQKISELRAKKKDANAKSGWAPAPAAEPERPAPSDDTRREAEADGRPAEAVSREGAEPKGTDAPALHPPEPQRAGPESGERADTQAAEAAPDGSSTGVVDRGPTDPELRQPLSAPTLAKILWCLGRWGDKIRFDTLYSWVVCCVTAEDCMDSFECCAQGAPVLAAAECRDDSARRAAGLQFLVEGTLAQLVARHECVHTADVLHGTVMLQGARSPELQEALAEVQADYDLALEGARQALHAGALSDDEVRLRAAAALRHEQDQIMRRLLADAALEEVRRIGRVPPPPAGSTPSSGR
jgi:hypothetical protein